jgi:hypothetical protein
LKGYGYFNLTIKTTLFFCLILFGPHSQAKQLKVYRCNSPDDAERCSVNCQYEPGIAIEFLVEKQKNLVMRKVYEKSQYVSSSIMKNCSIFDESNWDCSRVDGRAKFAQKMTSGIYVDYFSVLKDDGFVYCAK